jgi:hypothetical protein
MKMSAKKREELYQAIYDSLMDVRIKLHLIAAQDVIVAQAITKIWKKQKEVLTLHEITAMK